MTFVSFNCRFWQWPREWKNRKKQVLNSFRKNNGVLDDVDDDDDGPALGSFRRNEFTKDSVCEKKKEISHSYFFFEENRRLQKCAVRVETQTKYLPDGEPRGDEQLMGGVARGELDSLGILEVREAREPWRYKTV